MVVTLTSVALVMLGQREGDALLVLGPLVSTFLGPSPHLSLSEACALASTSLLDWMWSLSCTFEASRAAGWRLSNYLRSEPHYYHWQLWKATKVAAERGDLALVSWLVAHFSSCTVSVEVVEAAAKNGHLGVLQFLLEHDAGRYCRHKHTAMTTKDEEVSFQSIPLLKSRRMGRGCHVVHWGGRSIVAATKNGHSEVGRWLYMHAPHELNAEEIRLSIEVSLKVRDMELASFLLPPSGRLVDFAYMVDRPEVIEMMLDAGILREDPGAAAASIRRLAKSERLDLMLRIARLHSPPLPPTHFKFDWRNDWFYAAIQACEIGDVDTVKWLVQHPLSKGLCETDLMFGRSSEIAHWFCVASGAGQIEAMEFLYEQDLADQIARSLVRATHNGHLNAVQWIFEHFSITQLNIFELVVEEAAKGGYLDIVKYIDTLGGLATRPTTWSIAAEHGHLEVVEWLHNHRAEGCSAQAMDGAAANGHLEVMQWLHDKRSEGCSTAAMDGAAMQGHLHVLKWLFHHRSEGCTGRAAIDAAEHGHVHIVAWLRDHYPEFVPSQQNMVIFPPKQFEVILFLHEIYPHIFNPENGDLWSCWGSQRHARQNLATG